MAGGLISRAAAGVFLAGAAIAPAAADDTGFAYAHDLRREGGRQCMSDHYHFGSGSGGSKAAAQREAIISWSSFTDFEYGSDWARWSRAAGKGITCSKGGGGIDCQVQARPCR
jgi:hypothetical protein